MGESWGKKFRAHHTKGLETSASVSALGIDTKEVSAQPFMVLDLYMVFCCILF